MSRYRRINIEISNICNLQCNFCPEVHRQKQVMSSELFSTIMHQASPLTDEVCLHLMGEPLGHPELRKFVEICESVNVPINISSNGLLLNADRTELLLRPIVRQVNFSVHSFAANFPGQSVANYAQKILRFTRLAMTERPDLYINYRLWDLDDKAQALPENLELRQILCEEFAVEFNDIKIDIRRKKGYKLGGRVYLNLDSRFEWPSPNSPVRSTSGTCHGLSTHFGILADGAVVPCCLDKEGVIRLGNVRDTKLSEILSCSRASAMRQGFAEHKLLEDLCQRCTFIERFDRKAAKAQPGRVLDLV
jgi:radical SAM protein with 4Fe4S-binding SPASM domain